MELTIQSTEPGEELWNAVRAAFVARGSSLFQWTRANGMQLSVAMYALKGRRNGPKAKALRQRAIRASGLRVVR